MNFKKNIYPNPDHAKPPKPTAAVRQIINNVIDEVCAAISRNTVWNKNPPQLNIFRTLTVVKEPLARNQSAMKPPN